MTGGLRVFNSASNSEGSKIENKEGADYENDSNKTFNPVGLGFSLSCKTEEKNGRTYKN